MLVVKVKYGEPVSIGGVTIRVEPGRGCCKLKLVKPTEIDVQVMKGGEMKSIFTDPKKQLTTQPH